MGNCVAEMPEVSDQMPKRPRTTFVLYPLKRQQNVYAVPSQCPGPVVRAWASPDLPTLEPLDLNLDMRGVSVDLACSVALPSRESTGASKASTSSQDSSLSSKVLKVVTRALERAASGSFHEKVHLSPTALKPGSCKGTDFELTYNMAVLGSCKGTDFELTYNMEVLDSCASESEAPASEDPQCLKPKCQIRPGTPPTLLTVPMHAAFGDEWKPICGGEWKPIGGDEGKPIGGGEASSALSPLSVVEYSMSETEAPSSEDPWCKKPSYRMRPGTPPMPLPTPKLVAFGDDWKPIA